MYIYKRVIVMAESEPIDVETPGHRRKTDAASSLPGTETDL